MYGISRLELFGAQDVRGTSALRRPKWNVDSGATLTDRWVAERSNMGINGVGSFYVQNYDVPNRGRATRGKTSVDDFASMGSATSLSESSDNRKRGFMVEDQDSFANGTMDYRRIISERRNEIYEKLKNGDTEESFQIGGNSFTEKEWDKLLAEVDDITEEMREAMREEHEKRFAEAVKETTSNSTDNVNETDIVSKLFETQNSEIKVSNFKEHETPNYKFVPEPDIGSGGMRILKNGQSVAVFSVDDLKIRVDEKTGTRLLISEMGGFGGAWYDAIPVDAELENGLAEAIGVDDIPEVELEGYYIGTHAGTGIQYVMRPGDEGRGGKVLLRNAGDVAKYNALAEEYYNRYPNLVTSQEAGRIYASFEICGMQERTSTGFVNIRYDSISYHDNFDYKKNWSAKLTGDTWDMLWQWLEENRSRMEKVGEFSILGNIIDKLGGSYERIWSDEELEQGYLNN